LKCGLYIRKALFNVSTIISRSPLALDEGLWALSAVLCRMCIRSYLPIVWSTVRRHRCCSTARRFYLLQYIHRQCFSSWLVCGYFEKRRNVRCLAC